MLRRMAEWGDPQPARLYVGFNDEREVFGIREIEAIAADLSEFSACGTRTTGQPGVDRWEHPTCPSGATSTVCKSLPTSTSAHRRF